MPEEGLFEVKDESKLNEIIPLVNEPYTYENMVNNPIIKPIAECDRSMRDLDEMVYKKSIDIKKLKERINAVIVDVPSYQDSSFVADLIKLSQSMDDVIKLQDIRFDDAKECIKKMAEEVRMRYGVKLENKEEFVEPTTVFPEGSVLGYLDKLSTSSDSLIVEISRGIKEIFLKTTRGKDDKEKFENAGIEYYGKETNKGKRQTIARIIRMEI